MWLELLSATNLILHFARIKGNRNLTEKQLQNFQIILIQFLSHKYTHHWAINNPIKGSGFRCLRINKILDPAIKYAAQLAHINISLLQQILPLELTIWIDPYSVDYRIGENGSICNIFQHRYPIIIN